MNEKRIMLLAKPGDWDIRKLAHSQTINNVSSFIQSSIVQFINCLTAADREREDVFNSVRVIYLPLIFFFLQRFGVDFRFAKFLH